MKQKHGVKQYIVRKYIMATSVRHALRIEKTMPADEAWIDEDWKKKQSRDLNPAIGFAVDDYQE